MTNDPQKSDPSIRAMKSANKPEGSGAESMERRGGTKGNTEETHTRRAQDRASVTTGLDRVRARAKERKEEKFTTLLHHVDTDLLRRAYFQLKRKAAPGVDRVTWQAYGEQLEANLADLHERVHRGAYRAPPSRWVYIEKEDGRKRPLGIASLEDKLLQRAVIEVLNAIYEADFLGFSYGFRPGRSQHDALDALAYAITTQKVNFILDLDVERFFDQINHGWLIEFLKHRIADRRVLRLIGKWLKAGVMEDAVLVATEEGTPQGGSASPFLANAYLHYCFDLWAERWRRREASGQVTIVRFADDIVCGFEHEADAKRFLEQLRERMGKFSLSLHPEKTRLIEFGRSAAERRAARGENKPETFNFLGFTHIAGKSRAGRFQLKRKTRRDRLRRKVDAVRDEEATDARSDRAAGEVSGTGGAWVHPVPRRPGQLQAGQCVPQRGGEALEARVDTAQPEGQDHVGADNDPGRALAAPRPHPPSLARCPLSRQTPEVGAECLNQARSDLCGGCRVTGIPTAIQVCSLHLRPRSIHRSEWA
jgi:RNA-directed DNA polymerase